MPTPDPVLPAPTWLDALPSPAWATDAQGRVVFVNRALLEYGGPPTGSAGHPLTPLLHPEDREGARASWRRSQGEGTPAEHEVRLRGQDGTYRWFCVRGGRVDRGPGVTWVAVAHDIHDLKLVEARAARLQEVTAALAGAHDVPGVLAALPLAARVLGAPRASLTVLRGGELHLIGTHGSPEEGGLLADAAEVLGSGKVLILDPATLAARSPQLVGRQEAPSGTLALLPLVADGRPVGVLTLGFAGAREVDEAERRFMLTLAGVWAQALERARLFGEEQASRERVRAVLDAAPQLMWTSRPQEPDVHFNRTWAEYTGLGERLGRETWARVIHPDDLEGVRAAREASLAGGEGYTREVRFRRFDGVYRWHQVVLRPLEGGEWLGSATDVHDRKEAELALSRSEARLAAVLDALPVGVLIADASGRLLRDNAAHRELWGVAPETTNWEGYGEWVGWWPDTGARIAADEWAMSRALLGGERVQGELVEYQPFGSRERRFYLNNAAPIHDPEGHLIGGVVAEQDVTDRMAAERGLREHAARVQLALSAGAILGTWFWDLPTDRFTVDEGFAVNFGLDPALGREGLSLEQVIATVHPDDRAGLIAAIEEVTARGGPYAHQYRVRRRDGQYYWIEANGRVEHAADGTPLSFPGVLLDVEERRAMLGALRESEARFRELADHISQFAWTADASGAITWYNRRWYDYTGTTPAEMRGWGWTGVHHPDHVDRVVGSFRRAVAAGEAWEDTFPLRGKGGTYRWFLSRAVPIREGGEVVRWFGTNTDVTEQLAAQAELRDLAASLERRVQERTAELGRQSEELRRSNTELEQFAYVASHDLQAPIRAVTSFAELLERRYGPTLDERGRLYLRQISEGGGHMKRLVDDLLAFSRVHTARRPLTPTDAGAVVDAVARRLRPETEDLGARVTWEELPVILADPPQLDQLLQNLISNGLKYHRAGVAPRVHVSAERDGGWWRFSVTDNGIGIEPQYAERIFVIFQRLHGRDEYEGTGIGLAVCKKIVERHGGRLWLESTPGEGTTFLFTLPAEHEPEAPAG